MLCTTLLSLCEFTGSRAVSKKTGLKANLDGGGVVKFKGLGLAILQVDLQDIGEEEQRVALGTRETLVQLFGL